MPLSEMLASVQLEQHRLLIVNLSGVNSDIRGLGYMKERILLLFSEVVHQCILIVHNNYFNLRSRFLMLLSSGACRHPCVWWVGLKTKYARVTTAKTSKSTSCWCNSKFVARRWLGVKWRIFVYIDTLRASLDVDWDEDWLYVANRLPCCCCWV